MVGHSAGSIFAAHALRHLIDLKVTLEDRAVHGARHHREGVQGARAAARPSRGLPVADPLHPQRQRRARRRGRALRQVAALPGEQRVRGKSGASPSWGWRSSSSAPTPIRTPLSCTDQVAPAIWSWPAREGSGRTSASETHGGFDNDPRTLNSVMYQILGGPPKRLFQVRDLQFEDTKDAAAGRGRRAGAAANGWGAHSRRG